MKRIMLFCIGAILLVVLTGCQSKEQQAISTVEAYLQALVKKDEATFVKFTCPDWQPQALLEFDAFGNVATVLKDLNCKADSLTSETATVKCTGSIDATYQDEVQSFPLSDRNFQLTHQGGDWLVCGY